MTFNKQHDVNNMLLAENDHEKYKQWLRMQEKINLSIFKECKLLSNLISLISKEDDTFNSITVLNGNQIHVYSKNNIAYIPTWVKVLYISILQTIKCFKDKPIFFKANNS